MVLPSASAKGIEPPVSKIPYSLINSGLQNASEHIQTQLGEKRQTTWNPLTGHQVPHGGVSFWPPRDPSKHKRVQYTI